MVVKVTKVCSKSVFHGSRLGFIFPGVFSCFFNGSWSVFMVFMNQGWFSNYYWFQVGFSWFQVVFHGSRRGFMVYHDSRLVLWFSIVPGWG